MLNTPSLLLSIPSFLSPFYYLSIWSITLPPSLPLCGYTSFSLFLAKPRKSNEKPSNLFQSLEFFLSNLALHDIEAAVKCFDSSLSTIHTPREIEDYNRVKCSLVLQLLNFVSILLDKHLKQAFTVSAK